MVSLLGASSQSTSELNPAHTTAQIIQNLHFVQIEFLRICIPICKFSSLFFSNNFEVFLKWLYAIFHFKKLMH